MEPLKVFVFDTVFVGTLNLIKGVVSIVKEVSYKFVLITKKAWVQALARAPGFHLIIFSYKKD
jgi:hypothetical protein